MIWWRDTTAIFQFKLLVLLCSHLILYINSFFFSSFLKDILYRPSVINIIMAFLKDTEIKVLACRMCNKLFRSALGLVMHIEKCGAEIQRVDCEYCHRNYSTASLPSHLRSCSQRIKSSKPIEDDDNPEMSTDELNLSNTGRTKRHSTLKAESKLKQMGAEMLKAKEEDLPDFDPKKHIRYSAPLSEDVRKKWSKDLRKCAKCFCPKKMCSYASDKIEDLEEHIKTCRFISKSGYYCTLCRKRCFTSEKEAIDHINTAHRSGEDFSGSDSDCNIKTDDDVTSNDEDDDDVSEGVDEDECSTNDTASQNTKKKCRNPPKRTPHSPSKSSNASIVLRKRGKFMFFSFI